MQNLPTNETTQFYASLDLNEKENLLKEAYELRMTINEYIETVLYYDMLDETY